MTHESERDGADRLLDPEAKMTAFDIRFRRFSKIWDKFIESLAMTHCIMRDHLFKPSVNRNMQNDPDCQKQLIVSQYRVIFDELKYVHFAV